MHLYDPNRVERIVPPIIKCLHGLKAEKVNHQAFGLSLGSQIAAAVLVLSTILLRRVGLSVSCCMKL